MQFEMNYGVTEDYYHPPQLRPKFKITINCQIYLYTTHVMVTIYKYISFSKFYYK